MFLKNEYALLVGLVILLNALGVLGQDAVSTASDSGTSAGQTTTSDERPFQIGFHYNGLAKSGDSTRHGLGFRIGYDVVKFGGGKYVATAESEFNFFPDDKIFSDFRKNGRISQGLFGVKVGRKAEKWGLFAKVRPGYTYFSKGDQFSFNDTNYSNISVTGGKTSFTTDVGGVLEFYPTKKFFTRFDFGDAITRLNARTINYDLYNSTTGLTTNESIRYNGQVKHFFQYNFGVGFRF